MLWAAAVSATCSSAKKDRRSLVVAADDPSTLTHLAAAVETLTATRHELFNLLA